MTDFRTDESRSAEELLLGSEQQLRLLIDFIPALVWCATPTGELFYFNKRFLDFTGMSLAGAKAQESGAPGPIAKRIIIHPDDVAELERLWALAIESGGPLTMRHRLCRHDGVYRWFDMRAEPLRNNTGRIVQWYGVCVDVDESHYAEQALRNREQQLRLLIDTIPALVWCAAPDGEPTYFNKPMIDFIGMPLGGFEAEQGGSLGAIARRSIIHKDDLAELERLWSESILNGRTLSMKHRLRRRDGVYRWVDLRAEPLRDDEGRIVQWYGVSVDIDEENRIQEALRETNDKLARASQAASLSELSASIAHEVNQPLAAVITNSYACQRWLSAEPPNLERARIVVDRVIRDANSAAEVVSKIRALFKQAAGDRLSVNLNEVVVEVSRLTGDIAAKVNVKIALDLDEKLPPVKIDRVQVQQVLVNLIRNGIEAMQSNTDVEKSLSIRSQRDGATAVSVQVRDSGTGIDDPERIFEPFYTTKAHGMGMGLSISRSIIEAHNGRLNVIQDGAHGTTFIFTLPVSESDS